MEDGKMIRVLQPTYQVDPSFDNRFVPNEVHRNLKPHVDKYLKDKEWSCEDKDVNSETATGLTTLVMEKLKDMGMTRYKIIVQTAIGENKGQTVRVGSQCLWEPDYDNIAELNFKNERIWSSVVVIGFLAH